MATKSMLLDKVADINRLLNHKFTNEELNEKLRKQGSLDSKTFVWKRMETEKQLKMAKAAGDYAEVERLESEMAQMTGGKLTFGNGPKPQANKQSEHERLAELNLRNQRLNYESVRRAQLDERKASKMAAARGQAKAQQGANGSNGAPPANGDSRYDTPTTGPDTPGKANTPSAIQKKPVKGGIAGIRHKNMDDENIAALDLDLDIEI